VGYVLFVALLLLAVLPAFAPRWSWFFVTFVFFVAVSGLTTWVFVRELSVADRGEGPAVFGFIVYAWVVAGLFVGSCALMLLVIGVLAVLRRLAPTPQSLFAPTAPPLGETVGNANRREHSSY
jgi:FtsH-binding integral membrane protein